MPNYCSNYVEVRHADRRKIVELRRAFRQGRMLDYICPVPKDLTDTVAGSFGDDAQQAALEAQTARNVEKYGYGNWYDYCVSEWGTKWDCGERGGDTVYADKLGLNFESAWAPPIAAYEKMIEQGYEITAYYYEPGMAFVGKWEDGVDECYEYSGQNSRTVRNVIGDELDDMFSISESMAEYEEENEEEEELTEWIKDGVEARKLETL